MAQTYHAYFYMLATYELRPQVKDFDGLNRLGNESLLNAILFIMLKSSQLQIVMNKYFDKIWIAIGSTITNYG